MTDAELRNIFGQMDAENPPEYPAHYPPPALWSPDFSGEDALRTWRTALGRKSDLVLYVHIPFCREICGFCGFYSQPVCGNGSIDDYLALLEKESGLFAPVFKGKDFTWLCFGGGTPSLLSNEQLEKLFGSIKKRFRLSSRARIAFESHPDSLDFSKIRLLKKLGVDWLSIGVQTFDGAVLKKNGRAQDNSRIPALLKEARQSGIKNIQLDIMAGLPFQTESVFLEDVRRAALFQPERIYLFPFQSKDRVRIKTEQAPWLWDAYKRAVESLTAKGYQLSCGRWLYRKSGGEWPYSYDQGEKISKYFYSVLGLGAGAISYSRFGARYQNAISVDEYARRINAGRAPVLKGFKLKARDEMINFILLSLVQRGMLGNREFASVFGKKPREVFGRELAALSSGGILVASAEGWFLTDRESGLFQLRKNFYPAGQLEKAAEKYISKRLSAGTKNADPSSPASALLPGALKGQGSLKLLSSETDPSFFAKASKGRGPAKLLSSEADPAVFEFHVTGRCQLNCRFCPNKDGQEQEPRAMAGKLLRALKERRPLKILFSGGEPLLNPALLRFMELARRASCSRLAVFTNGLKLADKHFARTLKEGGLDWLEFSMHGGRKEVHEAVCGGAAWEPALRGLENALSLGIAVRINCAVTSFNAGLLQETAAFFIRRLGVKAFRFIFLKTVPGLELKSSLPRFGPALREIEGILGSFGAKARFSTANLPPCLMPQYPEIFEDFSAGRRTSSEPGIFRPDGTVKPPRCSDCLMQLDCPGLDAGYAALYGSRGIKPLKRAGV